MRVLWSVNVVLPDIAHEVGLKRGHAISWVDAMRTSISENEPNIELAIVCYGGIRANNFKKHKKDNITYYILPFSFNTKKYWDYIIEDFKPDIIHIYGTERKQNISLIENYNKQIPMIISLQGIISEYEKHYYAKMSAWEILSSYTFRDILFRNGIIAKKNSFKRQSLREQKMFLNVKAVEGRSDWDRAITSNINPNLDYYYCPRMIRKPFWDYKWNREKFEGKSLFVHQGDYPIKGLHFMIDALNILVKKYPDIKLYVSGDNIFQKNTKWERGYTRFIRKKIAKYHLENNIVFTGYLNAEQLAQQLSRVNVCVIPSAIENAPNALAEAMLVGTPCIASYVGGNADMLNYGELGLLYCYYEPQLLAARVDLLINDNDLAAEFSEKARTHAVEKHDPGQLRKTLITIYENVIKSFEV